MSYKRRKEYASVNFKKLIENNISEAAKNRYIKMLGPGKGLDPDKTSLLTVTKALELHQHLTNIICNKGIHKRWRAMTKPSNEAWFDPWIIYLKSLGLKLYLNTELKKYSASDINICNAVIHNLSNDKYSIIGNPFTIFINCTDPFTFKNIILKSFSYTPKSKSLLDSINLVSEGVRDQIGFTLEFNKKIKLPSDTVFTFSDSEFNILLCPQDNFFKNDPYISKSGNSYWSGTICTSNKIGKLFNKTAIELNQDQLLEEIKYQIFRSKEFINLIKKYNIVSDNLSIINQNIWHEWKYNNILNKLESTRPEWITTTKTYKYRPDQKTNFKNLYIAGAHTKTSSLLWTTDGAVESGKIVANHILSNKMGGVTIIKHKSPWYLIPFQVVDDLLYMLYLPNIINMILLIIIIYVSIYICVYTYRYIKRTI